MFRVVVDKDCYIVAGIGYDYNVTYRNDGEVLHILDLNGQSFDFPVMLAVSFENNGEHQHFAVVDEIPEGVVVDGAWRYSTEKGFYWDDSRQILNANNPWGLPQWELKEIREDAYNQLFNDVSMLSYEK